MYRGSRSRQISVHDFQSGPEHSASHTIHFVASDAYVGAAGTHEGAHQSQSDKSQSPKAVYEYPRSETSAERKSNRTVSWCFEHMGYVGEAVADPEKNSGGGGVPYKKNFGGGVAQIFAFFVLRKKFRGGRTPPTPPPDGSATEGSIDREPNFLIKYLFANAFF